MMVDALNICRLCLRETRDLVDVLNPNEPYLMEHVSYFFKLEVSSICSPRVPVAFYSHLSRCPIQRITAAIRGEQFTAVFCTEHLQVHPILFLTATFVGLCVVASFLFLQQCTYTLQNGLCYFDVKGLSFDWCTMRSGYLPTTVRAVLTMSG